MKAPIFIVGANRSGTTLLRLLLNAHSEISIPDEINYFYGFDWSVSYKNWQSPSLSRPAFEAFVDRFLTTNEPKVPGLDLSSLRPKILNGPIDLRQPYKLLLEHWAQFNGKVRWGEKTPGNIYHAQILLDMFPDATFIHLIRDPRGGVASMKRVAFYTEDAVFNALNRHKVMTHGRTYFHTHVPAEQRIEIRYEDLVVDPRQTLKKICSFIQVPYEETMLRFHLDAERFMTKEASSSFNAAATQPISSSFAEKWKTTLTSDEIASIELICAPEMKEFNYLPLSVSLSWKGALNFAIKWSYWQIQRRRHRHDRHFSVVTNMFGGTKHRLRMLKHRISRQIFAT
jgi:hypothetical protein